MEEVEETPHPSLWWRLGVEARSRLWQAQHWLALHLCGLHFCHSCSGYFFVMTLPDQCEACYARDHGVPVLTVSNETTPIHG